jgi:sigma-B regulation protein RsbU (phosphoserine phosphatase)
MRSSRHEDADLRSPQTPRSEVVRAAAPRVGGVAERPPQPGHPTIDLALAQRVQRAQFPRQARIDGLTTAIYVAPAYALTGDAVTVLPLADGRVLCSVADATGSGVHAALVGSTLLAMLHVLADRPTPLAAMLERVNAHFAAYLPDDVFVTAAAAAIAPTTGELEVLVAGHPPPIVCDARGACRALDRPQNPPLGLASSLLRTGHTRLATGDLLALYSDGVVEVRDPQGRMLGTHALARTLSSLVRLHGASRVGAIARALRRTIEDFAGPDAPRDDRSFLLVGRP